MITQWRIIEDETEERSYDLIRQRAFVGVQDLYSIRAADKAKAVPYLKIVQVKRDTNEVERVISDSFFTVPRFGTSMNKQFGERPNMSLNSVTVKSVNPGGWILYREVDIDMVVHNPAALKNIDQEPLGAILKPGATFIMTYGWKGGTNPVLGPGRNILIPDDPGAVDTQTTQTLYPARRLIRFTITHYNFKIGADGNIQFHIHGIEDAELFIRSANIFNQSKNDFPKPPTDLKLASEYLKKQISAYFLQKWDGKTYKIIEEWVQQEQVPGDPNSKKPQKVEFVKFRDVLDILFFQPLLQCVSNLGYTDPLFLTGLFNDNSPQTASAWGQHDTKGKPIGEFLVLWSEVKSIIDHVIQTRGEITVYALLKGLMRLMSAYSTYNGDQASSLSYSVPEIQLFTEFNPDNKKCWVFVVDRKRYLTKLTDNTLNEHNIYDVKKTLNKARFLNDKRISELQLYRRDSFFKDVNFEVIADEQMKSIFVQRALNKSREQITTGNQSAVQTNQGTRAPLLLYRSAIKGSITMIGNFVYDLLGLTWITFGIPQLDGIFYVLQRTDRISKDMFETTVEFQAEGSDPLGVVNTANTRALPDEPTKPTREQSSVAEDKVREMILAQRLLELNKLPPFGPDVPPDMASGTLGSNTGPDLSQTSTPAVSDKYKQIAADGNALGFTATATTGGHHNIGSLHGQGKAVDFSVKGKTSAQVDQFIAEMRSRGYNVNDERQRPAGQAVWSGPHVHVSSA